jgi:tetratricopeptide (TPR) repeat protein
MVNEEAEGYKAAGNALVGKKKYAEAVKKYKKASSLDPTNVVYWSNMAFCYDKIIDLSAFKETAQKCVDIDPTFIKGYYRLAKAHELLWEYNEEHATIVRGLAVDPNNSDLLQMLRKVEFSINIRKALNKDTLKVPTSNLQFLGGLNPGEKCKIPKDSAYGRLTRSPLPPQSKKHKDLSQYSKHVRPVFEAFYNGELRIEWALENGADFLVNGFVGTDIAPVIAYRGSMEIIFTQQAFYKSGIMTQQNIKFHLLLTNDQKKDLSIVMIQRFLREKAALLKDCDRFLKQLVTNLAGECNQLGMYKIACDLHLTYTDVCLNRGLYASAITAVHFCEALESAKRYKDAADIYVEISDAKVFQRHPGCDETRSRGYAGLAYKRAMDYIGAEREYVGSLRVAGPNWNLDPNLDSYCNLSNMMIFYEIAHRAVINGLRVDEAHKKIQKACFLLVGLLSIAGFNGQQVGCTLFEEKRTYQDFLKPQYKSRKKAMRAVVAASMAPTIDEYHKLLFSYQPNNLISMQIMDPTANLEEMQTEFLEDQKAKSKSGSREHTQLLNNWAELGVCTSCKKTSQDMKECPCHTVKYCSKDCQISHWKIHSKVCPNRKKC